MRPAGTNRTFHHKVTPEVVAGLLLLGTMALVCFWQRDTLPAIMGTLIMAAGVVAIERTIHTTYVLSADRLVVSRGRFAKPVEVRLTDIVRAERLPTALRTSHYILLQIGASRHLCLRPDNEESFLKEIKKRQQHYEAIT